MKWFVRLALLSVPLALTPQIGLAQPFQPPLSVASGDPLPDFQDIRVIVEDVQALVHAEVTHNQAAIIADNAALQAAIKDFLAGVPASPAV